MFLDLFYFLLKKSNQLQRAITCILHRWFVNDNWVFAHLFDDPKPFIIKNLWKYKVWFNEIIFETWINLVKIPRARVAYVIHYIRIGHLWRNFISTSSAKSRENIKCFIRHYLRTFRSPLTKFYFNFLRKISVTIASNF